MALTSPIFRKLLIAAFLLMAGTLLGLNFYLTRFTIQLQTENIQRRLRGEADILAEEAARIQPSNLQGWARQAEARGHAHVVVVDPQGIVLADSRAPANVSGSLADHAEVQKALQGTVGTSVRSDSTLDEDLYYLAVPLRYQGRPGYALQLAVPLTDVKTATQRLHGEIWVASLVALILALAIAYFFSQSFTRRVNDLKVFAENLDKTPSAGRTLFYRKDELGALGRSLNLTGHRMRELVDRLSLESARRESILASMVEGVLAIDSELRITFSNDSFCRAVGASAPIPERQPLLEVLRDPELLAMFTRVLESRQPLKQRVRLAGAEGRSFEVQVTPLAGTARGGGAIAIFYDITDLERLERIRKDFVANVSHELRTPLTAIRGYAETLLEGALEDRENNRKFVEIIKAHATRLGNIASDLLTLSELESERLPVESRPVSVGAAVETALKIIEPTAQLRGITIVRGPQDEAEVLAERGQLEQALVNLLDNAVKFNRPGGEVRVEVARAPGDKIRITVADTGIGIPSTDLSRIFERFYRVDKARSREMGGTGLGLSIVKHVIERMDGALSVESQLGKGTAFTILLPVCSTESPKSV